MGLGECNLMDGLFPAYKRVNNIHIVPCKKNLTAMFYDKSPLFVRVIAMPGNTEKTILFLNHCQTNQLWSAKNSTAPYTDKPRNTDNLQNYIKAICSYLKSLIYKALTTLLVSKNSGHLRLVSTERQGGFNMLQLISVDSDHFTKPVRVWACSGTTSYPKGSWAVVD